MDTKTCSRCGVDKPLDNFRSYYGGRKGTYKYCKECERIESRRRYLVGLGGKATLEQAKTLAAIERLYDIRAERGLDVPGRTRADAPISTDDLVAQLLATESNSGEA